MDRVFVVNVVIVLMVSDSLNFLPILRINNQSIFFGSTLEFGKFCIVKYYVAYFAFNKRFGFFDEFCEVTAVELLCYDNEFYYGAVFAVGKVAYNVYFINVAQAGNYFFDDLVDANIFFEDVLYIGKNGVFGICLKYFFISFGTGFKKAGSFESVKLDSDGIGRFAKLAFETTQIGSCLTIKEELKQQFKSCF